MLDINLRMFNENISQGWILKLVPHSSNRAMNIPRHQYSTHCIDNWDISSRGRSLLQNYKREVIYKRAAPIWARPTRPRLIGGEVRQNELPLVGWTVSTNQSPVAVPVGCLSLELDRSLPVHTCTHSWFMNIPHLWLPMWRGNILRLIKLIMEHRPPATRTVPRTSLHKSYRFKAA